MNTQRDMRPVAELKLWDRNPRSIKGRDFLRLQEQIKKFGQYKPLIITADGTVIGGNMRLRAYREMGITDAWVSVVDAKTEQDMFEYALSDNDRAGYYDDDMLANLTGEFPDLQIDNFAIDMKEPQVLSDWLKNNQEVEEDEAPEVSEGEAVSKLGEVYQLGRHRLMCGDSTKIENVEKLMDGKKADMVFTDPPYGMDLDTDFSKMPKTRIHSQTFSRVIGDNKDYDPAHIFTFFPDVKDVLLWGGDWYYDKLPAGGSWYTWVKRNENSIGLVGNHFEMCWSKNKYRRELLVKHWSGVNARNSDYARSHPTEKPVSLMAEMLNKFEHKIIVDIFGGSGSTLIACEQTNRTCYMMELEPKYCDVIRKRYAKFIGKEDVWEQETPLVGQP